MYSYIRKFNRKYQTYGKLSNEDLHQMLKYAKYLTVRNQSEEGRFFFDQSDSKFILPIEGKLFGNIIPVKIFNSKSLLELVNTHKFDLEIEIEEDNFQSIQNLSGLFDEYTTTKYPNFTKIIFQLNREGKVEIESSNNTLSSSPYRFRITGEKDYMEVDCLGTNLHRDMTQRILNL